MDTKREEKSFQMMPVAGDSPTDTHIREENVPNVAPSTQTSRFKSLCKVSGVFIILVLLGLLTTGTQTLEKQTVTTSQDPADVDKYEYNVYCPIKYYRQTVEQCLAQKVPMQQQGDDDLRRLLTEQRTTYCNFVFKPESVKARFNDSMIYIVVQSSTYVVTQNEDGEKEVKYTLTYCGLARKWDGSCKNAEYVCSAPGPMFDVNTKETIDVIWINNLTSAPKSQQITGAPCSSTTDCELMVKDQPDQTFYQPTDLNQTMPQAQPITYQNWPTSTHIHGLQIRPTFDGNPLSWISNSGARGVGALSLSDTCYYSKFDDTDSLKFTPPIYEFDDEVLNRVAKTNRYPNIQNPGNLWYHDHAMRATRYNVQFGLSGLYIIRDQEVQKQLPTGIYERYIMYTHFGWKTIQLDHQADTFYRYRILNNHFGTSIKVSFKPDCSQGIEKAVNFTIIGADSSLFDKPMWENNGQPIKEVQLGSAQRVEVLIKFSKGSTTYSICDQPPQDVNVKRQINTIDTFQVVPKTLINQRSESNQKDQSRIESIPQSLNVAYINLKDTIESKFKVAVARMRPLILRDSKFMVNGHFSFHKGGSQNPMIGTIEDWYIINTISNPHPIHVHLINFQVIEKKTLRTVKVGEKDTILTLYEINFWLQALNFATGNNTLKLLELKAKYLQDGNIKYIEFGQFLVGEEFLTYSKQLIELAYKVNMENVTAPAGPNQPRISGINVQQKIDGNQSFIDILKDTSCPGQIVYKFVCQKQTLSKEWYGRWKDTAFVDGFSYFKYRIRWTKSDYKKGDKYFNVPADQLRQFPGFVYHCHILRHEDNEMMRPIMLEMPLFPINYQQDTPEKKCSSRLTWSLKYQCLNQACKDQNTRTLTRA